MRARLARMRRLLGGKFQRRLQVKDISGSWHDWMNAKVLLREAMEDHYAFFSP
jgi:hypothetical protein